MKWTPGINHCLRNGLKARIARMVEFRAGFKEKVAQLYASNQKYAENEAGQYLANVNIHLNPVLDQVDQARFAVMRTEDPGNVLSKLDELRAALIDYADTPIMENPSQHMEAAMSIINDQLDDDLQHLSTPA